MAFKYTQLTLKERYNIEFLIQEGFSNKRGNCKTIYLKVLNLDLKRKNSMLTYFTTKS